MLAARAEQPHRRRGERLPRGREIEAARRRLDARQHRRALRGRGDGDAHGVAERIDGALQALQQAIDAAEVAQARLHFEQHRVGGRAPASLAGCSETLRREGERGMRDRQHRLGVARRIGLAER